MQTKKEHTTLKTSTTPKHTKNNSPEHGKAALPLSSDCPMVEMSPQGLNSTLSTEKAAEPLSMSANRQTKPHNITRTTTLANEKTIAQTMLIARLSHSMRTAISSILGISEVMLHDKALPLHAHEAFEKIYTSGNILLGAANDIISLTKVKYGELPLKNAKYDTAKLIGDITQLHLIHLLNKNIEYKVDISPSIPQKLIGDELRIKRVLDTFLTNAFIFTELGTIEIKAQWEQCPCEPKKGALVFTLSYTGIHKTAENDEFVKMLGATINTNIVHGEGTRVRISIPQEYESDSLLGKSKATNLARFKSTRSVTQPVREPMPYGRVLVVDDVSGCLFVMQGILGFYEIQTDTATTGYGAIEKIMAGNVYDIIFMDHIMPDLDGVHATKAIREMGYTRPIVALTANTFSQEEDYINHGFDGYISKPLDPKKLDEILHRFVQNVQPQEILDTVATRKKPKVQKTEKTDTYSEIKSELRLSFVRKHKHVFTEITEALSNGEHRTARWLLDAIKNAAGMVGEPILANIAADTDMAIARGEIPARLLEMLNRELTTVFAGIARKPEPKKPLTIEETSKLFGTLRELLSTYSAEAIQLTEQLHALPNNEKLIHHLENFDFPQALIALNELNAELEARKWTQKRSFS
ncbi:MAG: response regulator [Defluviitaleaceae bacterium]|nr:response regulator [Defluviitaleaceae bacterium]